MFVEQVVFKGGVDLTRIPGILWPSTLIKSMAKDQTITILVPKKMFSGKANKLVEEKIVKRADVSFKGLKIKALVLETGVKEATKNARKRSIKKLLGLIKSELSISPTMDDMLYGEIDFNGKIVPLIGIANKDFADVIYEEPEDGNNKRAMAVNHYKIALEQLSALTGGCKFVLHATDKLIYDPYPDEPDVYHVFSNAGPTGEMSTRSMGKVFGKWLGDPEMRYLCPEAVPGRGHVILDEALKEPVIQIVGNNIYLLFPCFDIFSSITAQIFDEAMAKAWNFINYERESKTDQIKSASREEFAKATLEWSGALFGGLNLHIKEIMDRIEKLRTDLNTELGNLAMFNSAKVHMEKTEEERKNVDYGLVYDQLISDPRIESVKIIEQGISLTTKPILAEFEDKTYKFGIFGIRLSCKGRLSVWCEKSEHPKNIPHPHFQADGAVCFGNTTRAIEQAAAEMRIADTVNHVLDWLTYGYAPEYALNKIEEWPVEDVCLT